MTRKQRRLTMIGGSLAVLAVAAALVLNAMRDSIVFFSTPAMVAEKHIQAGKRFRLGGLVQPGSLVRGDNLAVTFQVADGSAVLPVAYKGILPDLFREGQGVVAEGALDVAAEAIVNPWDVAAAQVLVTEAGGRFSDLSGRPRFDGGSALSTNGLLHDETLAILQG